MIIMFATIVMLVRWCLKVVRPCNCDTYRCPHPGSQNITFLSSPSSSPWSSWSPPCRSPSPPRRWTASARKRTQRWSSHFPSISSKTLSSEEFPIDDFVRTIEEWKTCAKNIFKWNPGKIIIFEGLVEFCLPIYSGVLNNSPGWLLGTIDFQAFLVP